MSFEEKAAQLEQSESNGDRPIIQVGHAKNLEEHDESTYDWKAARKKGIGGSDAACILGMKPYGKTRRQLWEEKTGRLNKDIHGEALRFGHLIEPYIRQWLIQRAKDTPAIYGHFEGLVDYKRQMCHPLRPWQRGNTDGLIMDGDTPVAMLEIKQSKYPHGYKKYNWIDGVMEYHYPQNQHYLDVLGIQTCYYIYLEVAAERDVMWEAQKKFAADRKDEFWLWFIDQSTMTIQRVEKDQEYCDALANAEEEFWQCVENDVPPKEFLPDGEVRIQDAKLAELLEEYGVVHATIKEQSSAPAQLEDQKELLKDQIKSRAQILSASHGDAKKIYAGDSDDYVLWNKRGYWVAKPAERKPKSNEIEVPF